MTGHSSQLALAGDPYEKTVDGSIAAEQSHSRLVMNEVVEDSLKIFPS